jgi:hypothetical protein
VAPPARYLTTLVPLLAVPLAASLLGHSRLYRAIFGILAVVGFAFMGLMLWNPHLMFPVDRAYLLSWLAADGSSPIHVDLRPFIPAFAWPDLELQPFITGRIFAAAFLLVLFCVMLLEPRHVIRRQRAGLRALSAASWLAGLAFLGTGWYVMNDAFLKHKTVLTEQKRWQLSPPLQQPSGMVFAGGSLFLTDYTGRSMGALNLITGTYERVVLRSAGGTIPFGHPGDMQVGPSGHLYLLNNGLGPEALYVVRSDGRVLREETLQGKGPVSVGLAFDRHGGMYVADMVNGVIRKYPSQGGDALAAWGGITGGFNNVAGIAVDGAGRIYAAESSANRVQLLDARGRFVRSFDLDCSPQHLAVRGNWVDVTCGVGVVSIRRSTGDVQLSRLAQNDSPLNSPTGLAYGPDSRLYVLDGSTVVAYTVQH